MDLKLSFKEFMELKAADHQQGMEDEWGATKDDYEGYYGANITMLSNVTTKDGVFHKQLPVRIKPGSMTDTHVTVVRDTTYSPSLNDKPLRKGSDGRPVAMPKQNDRASKQAEEEEEWTIPRNRPSTDPKRKNGMVWNDAPSQGWIPALQQLQQGGMDPMMGGPAGLN
tara:strand:- start:24 stop:527 length:504 start_codon:yes stop_codon:yes gene_type:complete